MVLLSRRNPDYSESRIKIRLSRYLLVGRLISILPDRKPFRYCSLLFVFCIDNTAPAAKIKLNHIGSNYTASPLRKNTGAIIGFIRKRNLLSIYPSASMVHFQITISQCHTLSIKCGLICPHHNLKFLKASTFLLCCDGTHYPMPAAIASDLYLL